MNKKQYDELMKIEQDSSSWTDEDYERYKELIKLVCEV